MTTRIGRREVIGAGLGLAGSLAMPAIGRAATVFRIGILTDLTGPNSNSNGQGTVTATHMAAEDYMAKNPGVKIDILVADYQSKPDIATSIARDWIDRHNVAVISNVNNSAAALAISSLVQEKNRAALFTGPASSDLTGKACSANQVHWTYDTWALGRCTGGALVADGGTTWYFVAADYTFGKLLAHDTGQAVTAAGGKILGTVYHPFPNTTDFSSFLLQAKASGAKVIGLANSGDNTVNCVKQAREFGITKDGTRLAALLLTIPDVHALGLNDAQGLVLTEAFYWDLNADTRKFGHRFAARMKGVMPNMLQAGDFSANTHMLKAAHVLGLDKAAKDGRALIAQMKAMPTDDLAFGKGTIRIDGRKLNPMYLFQVKSPAESHYPWDYYKLLRTVPADQAFRPLDQGGCSLVHA